MYSDVYVFPDTNRIAELPGPESPKTWKINILPLRVGIRFVRGSVNSCVSITVINSTYYTCINARKCVCKFMYRQRTSVSVSLFDLIFSFIIFPVLQFSNIFCASIRIFIVYELEIYFRTWKIHHLLSMKVLSLCTLLVVRLITKVIALVLSCTMTTIYGIWAYVVHM